MAFENLTRQLASRTIVKFKQQHGFSNTIDNVILVWPKTGNWLKRSWTSWYHQSPQLLSFETNGLLILDLNAAATQLLGTCQWIDATQIKAIDLHHSFAMGVMIKCVTTTHTLYFGVTEGLRLDAYQYRNFRRLPALLQLVKH